MITNTKKISKKLSSGFSLLELVLAIAVFSLGSFVIATMLIDANINTRLSVEKIEALSYGKEGIEAVYSIRNHFDSEDWKNLPDGDYYLLASSTGYWEFTNTPDIINNKYSRTVSIIASSTPAIKNVAVNISWNTTPIRVSSTTLKTVLTNWNEVPIARTLAVPGGLVSYWNFDDAALNSGSGTTTDIINANNGTVLGVTATTGVTNISNTAYSFDGSSQYISVEGTSGLDITGGVTISAWIKTNSIGANQMVVWKGDFQTTGSGTYGLQLSDNGEVLYGTESLDVPNDALRSTTVLGPNTWYHVVGTFDPSVDTANIYVNGVLDKTSTVVITNPVSKISEPLYFGKLFHSSVFQYFNGSIDNIRIYNRVLNLGEVTEIYDSERQ